MNGKTMLVTDGKNFHSETVFLTGRVFRRCTFENCTLVSHGPPIGLEHCTFGPNIWRVEMTFHDANDVANFSDSIVPWMHKSLDPETFGQRRSHGNGNGA
jgi:hypothetical protein